VDLSSILSKDTLRKYSREISSYQRQQNNRRKEIERQKREEQTKGSPLLSEYAAMGFELEGLSLEPSQDESGGEITSVQSFPHLPGAESGGGLGFSSEAQSRLKQQRQEAEKKGHFEQGSGWAGVAGRGMGAWAPLSGSKPTPSKIPTDSWGTRASAVPIRKGPTGTTGTTPRRTNSESRSPPKDEDVEFMPPSASWSFALPNLPSSSSRLASESSSVSSSSTSIPNPAIHSSKNKKKLLLSSSSRRAYRG